MSARTRRLHPWLIWLTGLLGSLRWRGAMKALLAFVTVTVLTWLVCSHLDYYQIGAITEQFRVGQAAPRDIVAPKDIVWEDVRATEREREEAARQVEPVQVVDPTALPKAQDDLRALFDALYTANPTPEQTTLLDERKISPAVVTAARASSPLTQKQVRVFTSRILDTVMAAHLEDDADVQRALLLGEKLCDQTNSVDCTLGKVVLRAVIRPNWIIDEEKTAALRQQAREAVPLATHPVQKGQMILPRDTVVTDTDLRQLKELGLLSPPPLRRVAPIAALMLFAICALGLYLRNFCPAVYARNIKLTLMAGLIMTALWGQMTFGAEPKNEFLVAMTAIPAGNMAVAGLLGVPAAIVCALLTAVTAGLTAHHQYATVLLAVGSSLAGVMAVNAIWPARRTLGALASLIAINLLLRVSVAAIIPGADFTWLSLSREALEAGMAGLGAAAIAVGAIYLLARPFGITTHYRLMDLSNPNEPLLRRLLKEAPGTYHSSVMVSNMAEAAADAIGADMQLARVAALYHDVGKLKRPAFFVENQAPLGVENVHQRLSPKLSYLILISHVRDGVEFATRARLPDEVVDIIREHHGTSLAAFFYHRALQEANGQAVPEHEFRYPGPKPHTREAAVVMLADSVQASVKALKEPDPARIENMVHEIINSRLEDGQLDECRLTLQDLRTIHEVFTRILSGLYTYTRVEYPVIKGEGARRRAGLNSDEPPAAGDPALRAPGR
jgi:putative nucleotidyltransferase with HDIG domain